MKYLILIGVLLVCTACTTTTSYDFSSRQNINSLSIGYEVKVYTRDGQVHNFEIQEFFKKHIKSKNRSIAYCDIKKIDRRVINTTLTTLADKHMDSISREL